MRRIQQTAIVFMVVAVSVVGQERSLPAEVAAAVSEPLFVFEVEPARELPPATLAGAAHANDFATFDALFRANESEAYRPLHELWTYSVTDPIGAFYGPEMFERFARAYPRFAESISQYRIIDENGNAFYPSSETRAFLLAHAELGTTAKLPPPEGETALPAISKRTTRIVPRDDHVTSQPDAVAPALPSAPPVPLEPLPVVVAATGTRVAVLPPELVATIAPPPVVTTADKHGSSRGLFLVIIGLLGSGLLAMILRAPRDV